jgi:ribosomal protein L31E
MNPKGHFKSIKEFTFKKGKSKTGGKQVGYRHFSTIIKWLLESDTEDLLADDEKQKIILKKLKSKGVKTVKDLVGYKMVQEAIHGDVKVAMELIKQINENMPEKLEVTNHDIDWSKLTDEQLRAIAAGQSLCDIGIEET